jgi:hypothetical protein
VGAASAAIPLQVFRNGRYWSVRSIAAEAAPTICSLFCVRHLLKVRQAFSARYFYKRSKEFQAAPQLLSIHCLWDHLMQVRHDPPDFVLVAVPPQQTPDLPHVAVRTAIRTTTQVASPAQWKRNDVVCECTHAKPLRSGYLMIGDWR